ncbi:hypothetical protein SAMN05421747_103206 [Parapedobacter composti]|uniref:Uncharacterized protein n=1 Tax=Parapedobacter composti TaxID=623281 RepID=A0A1I1FXI8_9SPHI|nr:hypothetical protein SAMN05421747_103206 [Parapedobacter composti]
MGDFTVLSRANLADFSEKRDIVTDVPKAHTLLSLTI